METIRCPIRKWHNERFQNVYTRSYDAIRLWNVSFQKTKIGSEVNFVFSRSCRFEKARNNSKTFGERTSCCSGSTRWSKSCSCSARSTSARQPPSTTCVHGTDPPPSGIGRDLSNTWLQHNLKQVQDILGPRLQNNSRGHLLARCIWFEKNKWHECRSTMNDSLHRQSTEYVLPR